MKSTISQEQINDTAVSLGIPTIPFFQRRIARAYNLVETNKVNEISPDDGFYRVHSQYDDKIYTVEVNHGNPSCSCPDGEKTVYCKHMIASMMIAHEQEQTVPVLTVKETAHTEFVKASWVVTDSTLYTNVWQDLNGKICCVCGAYYKRDCIHKQTIRDYYDNGNGSKGIVNDCGTETAKGLQNKLNGSNGTGDTKSPSHKLDASDPFQECEMLDIDQIEGRSNGDLAHKLSNGEYAVSYQGIMKLATKHNIDFPTVIKDNKAVIAYAQQGRTARLSGKPVKLYNNSVDTAIELAKRNAARQLLPLPEIKALEKKTQLEVEFDWQKAKEKCLDIVPHFTLEILINDLVKEGKLRQAHSSDYDRIEWLMIYNKCKKDSEINGDGDKTPSPGKLAVCQAEAKDYSRFSTLKSDMLNDGTISRNWTDDDFDKLKEACKIDTSLFGKELGFWTLDIEPNTNPTFKYRRRYRFILAPMTKRCFWCGKSRAESILPDTLVKWGRYEIKASLCLECSRGEHPNGEELTQKFDQLYHGIDDDATDTVEVPTTVDDFVNECKQAEADVVDDTTVDDDTPTNGDGKRKLQIDKKRNIVLIESDGMKKPMTFKEVSLTFGGDVIMRLTQGIQLCGADISTVELDN
jgi:hypothetical protein